MPEVDDIVVVWPRGQKAPPWTGRVTDFEEKSDVAWATVVDREGQKWSIHPDVMSPGDDRIHDELSRGVIGAC